jgi:sarcosine oxidase subunit gamma
MTELNPNQTARRSPLYRRHQALNAQFEMVGDALLVSKYGDTSMEPRLAISLGLADLSTLPRTGFKGLGAPQWAASQAVQLPEQPNTAVTQADGSMVAKLSHQELLIVSDVEANSSLVNRLDQQQLPAQTYSLPRADSHSWLAVTGLLGPEMFSKICGVDLRTHKFAQGQIAQTSVAKINAVIVRHDLGTTPCFYIFSDIASTEFLWDCLLDAMEEYQGVTIGVAAIRTLAAVE